jgi:GT2 family glycosyltransferase
MTLRIRRAPNVTLVVTPREQFSRAQASLESVLHDDDYPCEIVYVDGGSPPRLAGYLAAQARQHDFTLVRTDQYLSPNRARNLGLAHVRTPYVVFLDNDVFVTRGWLEKLVACAEVTGADIVSPLVCEGAPHHAIIHCAGGETSIKETQKGDQKLRHFHDKLYMQGRSVSEMRPRLSRQETGLAEFHCMLVRTSVFDRIGPLDEGMVNTREHSDLCLQVTLSGGKVWLEPDSVVTYDYTGMRLSDWPFYTLRWSNEWELQSLLHLKDKYGLDEDGYFQSRVKKRGWRRREKIWKPLLKKLFLGVRIRPIENLVVKIDSYFNDQHSRRYAEQSANIKPRIIHQPLPGTNASASASDAAPSFRAAAQRKAA